MDINYGIFTNEDGSKELIELTEEEYDAVMEAREAMEEASNFNKLYNSRADKAEKDYRRSNTYRNIGNDNNNSTNIRNRAIQKQVEYLDKAQKGEKLKIGDKTYNAIRLKNEYEDARKHKHSWGSVTKDARDKYKDVYGGNKAKSPEEKYRANRYLDAQNAINGKKKKAVKEAVLDWYEENGIEIDDYELGRIDSFVENYVEENF